MAFAQVVNVPSFQSKSDSLKHSSVALNALFLDDAMHHAAANAPSSALTAAVASTSNFADWNPLQRDVADWLGNENTNIDPTTNNIISTTIGSTTTILASSSTSSSPSQPDRMPTKDEINQLQQALAAFYGAEKNVDVANDLLGRSIRVWEETHQGGDEIAGLYRVRGDVKMDLIQPKEAEADYAKAIQYLEGPGGDMADPEELPAARLGRARAVRSLGSSATPTQALQASKDYEIYFNSLTEDGGTTTAKSSNSDGASFSEAIIDGIQRNPYAAWEWGMVNRVAHNYDEAAEIHRLAANAFEEIGDKPRSVICALDRGLDLASGLDSDDSGKGYSEESTKKLATATKALEEAISSDVNVEGRDVELLQRVVAKEGEARLALSGVLWNSNSNKGEAESQYGTACSRLDELNSDYNAREADRIKKGRMPPMKPRGASLGFSIDDIVGAADASCSRFRNDKFIEEKLVWNEGLQTKVKTFLTLGR